MIRVFGLIATATVFVIVAMQLFLYLQRRADRREERESELRHTRGRVEELEKHVNDLVASLVEARIKMNAIAKTTTSTDDRLMASELAERIGEKLIDLKTKQTGGLR